MLAVVLAMSFFAVDDPGVVSLSIPPQWAVVGQDWALYWDDCVQVDGAWSYDIAWSLTPAPDVGPTYSASSLTWTPSESGDFVLDVEFTSLGAHVANVSVDMHVASPSSLSGAVSVFGDSLSGGNVWQKAIADVEPGLSWLGTVATTNGLLRDSRGGWTWFNYGNLYNTELSPLVCGPESYCDDAGVPDVIVWSCGTNDASQASTIPLVAGIVGRLEALMQEWRRSYPNTKHIVWTPPPGADNDTPFIANYAGTPMEDQYYWEQRQRALSRALIYYYSGREAEGIYVAATSTGVDTANDYPVDNALHPTASGYEHLANSIRAVFAGAGL